MDDIPWLYVAMIFIAFVSWIHNRIQEAKEYRRARKIEKEKAARARRATEPAGFESPYRTERVPESAEEVATPKSFREVFQELERQFSEPDSPPGSPPERAPTPPPLPETDNSFQLPVAAIPVKVAPPVPATTRKRSNRNTGGHLVKTLRNGGNLKTALILKEILDKPKALNPR
ncbi:MAG: hypothetical protein P1U81_04735 [Verrucomicrobiales bacterium]|nr:hypothetical protein [Verrucomicrobiales bacterium]